MRGPLGLRSAAADAGALALLVATVAITVCATVLGVWVTSAAGRAATLLPVLVVAALAVSVVALEHARRRRPWTTLLRVRGASRARVLVATAAPLALAAILGGLTGIGSAYLVAGTYPGTAGLAGHFGAELSSDATRAGLLASVGVVAAAIVLGAAAGVSSREPLAAALRGRVRASRSGPAPLVGKAVIFVAAALTFYLALAAESTNQASLLTLAGAGVLGVAFGELAVRLLAVVGKIAPEPRSVGALVGLRRATGPGHAARVRAACAAGVVAVVGLSAVSAAGAWADRSERVRLGAPQQVVFPDAGAVEVLQLTRRLDPDGKWLMAGAVSDDRVEAELRVVRLDLARFDRVAGGFLQDTPTDIGSGIGALTAAEPVRISAGEALEATATTRGATQVEVNFLGPDGFVLSAALDFAGLDPGETETGTAMASVGCAAGCVVVSISASVPVELTELTLGGDNLLSGGWVAAGSTEPTPTDPSSTESGSAGAPDDGRSPLSISETTLVPAAAVAPIPTLTAGSPEWDGEPRVPGIAGDGRSAAQVGTREALPLVGASGLLVDLPVALTGVPGQGAAVRSVVLARDDTPTAIMAALSDAGGSPAQHVATRTEALGGRAAAELWVRQVVAATATCLAVLGLLAGAGRRLRSAERDETALRMLGVARRDLRTPVVVEAFVLSTTVAVAVAVGSWVVFRVLADVAGLVPTGPALLRLDRAAPGEPLLLGALGTGLIVAFTTRVPRGSNRRPRGQMRSGEQSEEE